MGSQGDNRVAMVVGGGSGIGRSITIKLANQGYDTIVVARTRQAVEAVSLEAEDLGARSIAVTADVTDDESITELYERIAGFTSGLDLLVYSAGDAFIGNVADTSPEVFQRLVEVNLIGAYRIVFHCRELLAAHKGMIVNIISRAGRQIYPNALAYGCAKAALVYLTRGLAMALASDGIRVNAISPGSVATDLRSRIFPDEDPSGLMQPGDVAGVLEMLLDPKMSSLNGAVLDLPWC